jgi:hypothetical protein
MAEDAFKELKEAPYPMFVAERAYSFDLNQDIVDMIKAEYAADIVAGKLTDAIKDAADAEKAAASFFDDLGVALMRKVIQLSDEYPDRTIEVVMESVDRQGNQFLIFPHLPQRYVEVGVLGTQPFLKVAIVLNNENTLAYRVPQCALFAEIKEQIGEDFANKMTCSNYCMATLETIRKDVNLDVINEQSASTATDGYCEFYMKKI